MLLKEVGAKIRPRSGNVLMVLTFAHLLIGLAFLGIVASHYSASDSAAFGMEVSEAEAQRRASIDTSRSPVSSTATTVFALFSAAVWAFLFFRRKRMEGREIRFIAMLLGPGTVMAIVNVALLVTHSD